VLKISAFLFAALIFFVSFFYQEKKENRQNAIVNPFCKSFFLIPTTFQVIAFASPAGGLRNCNAAAFASFKKFASPVSEFRQAGTEPKEAAYAVTDKFKT